MTQPFNVFIIPSWYPSKQYPIKGIFFREQAEIFSDKYQNLNFALSLWGQSDEQFLLWTKDHFKNIKKIVSSSKIAPGQEKIKKNLTAYFTPAFTWTRKLLAGNIANIVEANIKNLKKFETDYGKVKIIHAHSGYPAGFIAYHLSKTLNIPYVVTEHMSPLPFPGFVNSNGEWIDELKMAYEGAQKIIAVANPQKEIFANHGFEDVVVVPNFIDDAFYFPLGNKSKPVLNFLTVSAMLRRKGIDVLLYAIARIKDQLPQAFFTIAGIGDESETFKKLAKQLDIDKIINWTGGLQRHEVRDHLQNSDVFILPSRNESFGIAVIEALACGKPCIATRCGGPEDVVSPEVGLLIEKEDSDALANAILLMATTYKNYDPSQIRQYYEKFFSAKIALQKLKQVYDEAIYAYQ